VRPETATKVDGQSSAGKLDRETNVIEGNVRERGTHIDPGATARRAAGLHGPGGGDR